MKEDEKQKKSEWRKNKKKFDKYLKRRYLSMRDTHYKRLDKLNKTPPNELKKDETT
jgi:Skp family chaperone for outer membrane proteins